MPGDPDKLKEYLEKHVQNACCSKYVEAAQLITAARDAYRNLQKTVIINNTLFENPKYYVTVKESLKTLNQMGFQQICDKLRSEFINF